MRTSLFYSTLLVIALLITCTLFAQPRTDTTHPSPTRSTTGPKPYKEVIDETIEFIQRELMHEQKGFYSALDADSEGEEGKFYVWSHDEAKELLEENAEIFLRLNFRVIYLSKLYYADHKRRMAERQVVWF